MCDKDDNDSTFNPSDEDVEDYGLCDDENDGNQEGY